MSRIKFGGLIMTRKLDVLTTSKTLDGVERLVQLYPTTPSPADAFIPSEDALNLLLRFSITKQEREKARPIRALKKTLDPKLETMENYKVDYYIGFLLQLIT